MTKFEWNLYKVLGIINGRNRRSCLIHMLTVLIRRYLMKMAREVGSSAKLVGCAAYLQANTSARCPATGQADFRRQDILVDVFKHRAKR